MATRERELRLGVEETLQESFDKLRISIADRHPESLAQLNYVSGQVDVASHLGLISPREHEMLGAALGYVGDHLEKGRWDLAGDWVPVWPGEPPRAEEVRLMAAAPGLWAAAEEAGLEPVRRHRR